MPPMRSRRCRFRAADLRVERKPDRTPVTDADIAVEDAIRANCSRHAAPPTRCVGEERGGSVGAGRAWVIDPIDGTKNFLRGVPVWATLIALVVDGTPVVGVGSAPALGRRWWAAAGQGAWTIATGTPSQKDFRVSVDRPGRRLCVHHRPRRVDGVPLAREAYLRLADACWESRAFGDFWQHCLVAEGAMDVAAEAIVNAVGRGARAGHRHRGGRPVHRSDRQARLHRRLRAVHERRFCTTTRCGCWPAWPESAAATSLGRRAVRLGPRPAARRRPLGDLGPGQAAEQVVARHLLVGEAGPVVAVALLAPEHLPGDGAPRPRQGARRAAGTRRCRPRRRRRPPRRARRPPQPRDDRLGVHSRPRQPPESPARRGRRPDRRTGSGRRRPAGRTRRRDKSATWAASRAPGTGGSRRSGDQAAATAARTACLGTEHPALVLPKRSMTVPARAPRPRRCRSRPRGTARRAATRTRRVGPSSCRRGPGTGGPSPPRSRRRAGRSPSASSAPSRRLR